MLPFVGLLVDRLALSADTDNRKTTAEGKQMTLEEAKEDYGKRAAEFLEKHGSVGLAVDDDGMIDIGNGYKVTQPEAQKIMEDWL